MEENGWEGVRREGLATEREEDCEGNGGTGNLREGLETREAENGEKRRQVSRMGEVGEGKGEKQKDKVRRRVAIISKYSEC